MKDLNGTNLYLCGHKQDKSICVTDHHGNVTFNVVFQRTRVVRSGFVMQLMV